MRGIAAATPVRRLGLPVAVILTTDLALAGDGVRRVEESVAPSSRRESPGGQ
jgi:hypothetical protein